MYNNKKWTMAIALMAVIAAVLPACAPPGPETEEVEVPVEVTTKVEVEKPVEVEVEVETLPVLQVSVPHPLAGELGSVLEHAAESNDIEISVVEEPYDLSPCSVCGCHGEVPDLLFDPPVDLFLGDSASALHIFSAHELNPVPPSILDSVNPFAPTVQAFTDPDAGEVLGLAQGTAPLMLIYNPDLVGELPDVVYWDEMAYDYGYYGVLVPARSCLGLAAMQSALGEEFSESVIFEGDVIFDVAAEYASLMDDFFGLDTVYSVDPDQMLVDFMNQDAAFTLDCSFFLTQLAQKEYDGSVETTRFPVHNELGGSARSLAWMVPQASQNSDLAWELAKILTHDPEMIQWGLAYGIVPANESAFEMLPELADGYMLLPDGFLEPGGLRDSAAEATAWRIPKTVPLWPYNDLFLPFGDKLNADLANGEVSLEGAAALLAEAREMLKSAE